MPEKIIRYNIIQGKDRGMEKDRFNNIKAFISYVFAVFITGTILAVPVFCALTFLSFNFQVVKDNAPPIYISTGVMLIFGLFNMLSFRDWKEFSEKNRKKPENSQEKREFMELGVRAEEL